jgi:cytochrome c biogenesis protein ResB
MDNKKFDLDSVKKDEARQAFQPYYTPDISLLPPLPSTSNSKRKSSAQHYEDVSVDSGSNSDDSSSKFSMITNDKALSNRALATPNHRISDQNSQSNAIVSAPNSSLDNVPKHPIKNTKQFLEKLYNMLNDPECNHLVHWSPSGTSFISKYLYFIYNFILIFSIFS